MSQNTNEIIEGSHPVDKLYERAMTFAKNKTSKEGSSAGISNLYVLQKIDKDGNVTGEYYGMNMMTDYGMNQYFLQNQTFPTNIYIGNGTGSFNHTTNALLSAVTTTASTLSSSTKSYAYPLYYDNISGLITCVCKYIDVYFDYNISGITDTITISEYGIGTAYNALWTHSWVYDITGAQTYVTKETNEKLSITVFLCMSYYESLITDGYADERYTMITTMARFFNRMVENNIYTYKRYNNANTRSYTNTKSKFENNTIDFVTNLTGFTMYNGSGNDSGYIDGFVQWHSGFMTLEPQRLDTPENFEVIIYPMNNTPTGLSDNFGHPDKKPQFTQADITSVALFNYKTGNWDNYESFINDKNYCYCETPLTSYFPTPIYYTNNNTVVLMYVYQNIRVDDPIIGLDNLDLSTVYATDKYWDVSSWIFISDFNNIPEEAQTARYWITTTNQVSIDPIRKSKAFRLIPTNGDYEVLGEWTGTGTGCYSACDNYEYGWYMHGNTVFVPSSKLKFTIGNNGTTANATFTYGKWLVVFNSTTTYLLTDMSDLTSAPTPETKTPLFTTATNCLSNCYRTSTDTGILCLQSLSASEATIIDLRNNGFKQSLLNSKLAACVWGTNTIAYIPADDTTKIRIYDVTVSGDIKEFTIPDGVESIPLMFAHRDYIWITNGSSYSYVIDIRDGTTTGCENTIPLNSELNYIEFTAVDAAMIIYKYTPNLPEKACYVRYDNPTVPGNLSMYNRSISTSSITGRSVYTLRYIHENTLALIMSIGYYSSSKTGSYNTVCDFGRFLKTGTASSYVYNDNNTYASHIPFGEFIIFDYTTKVPTEYKMYHKIIGTTNTITTLNKIKNISGKQWTVSITNIPEFNGLPPGKVQ